MTFRSQSPIRRPLRSTPLLREKRSIAQRPLSAGRLFRSVSKVRVELSFFVQFLNMPKKYEGADRVRGRWEMMGGRGREEGEEGDRGGKRGGGRGEKRRGLREGILRARSAHRSEKG